MIYSNNDTIMIILIKFPTILKMYIEVAEYLIQVLKDLIKRPIFSLHFRFGYFLPITA